MSSVIRRWCRLGLVMGLIVLALPTGSRAYCIDYSQSLRLAGTKRLTGHWRVDHLATIAPVVYAVGMPNTSLFVLDVSDPSNVVEVSQLAFPQGISDVWAGGQTIIVRVPAGGLLLDASNPLAPVVTDTLPSSLVSTIYDVSFVGNLAYVATASKGLLVLDVSVPTAVQLLGSWDPGRYVGEMDVFGNRIYAAMGTQIDIVDITDPAHPVLADSLVVTATRLDIANGTMVVKDDYLGISLYTVDNYSPPSLFSSFMISDNILGVQISQRPDYSLQLVVCSTYKIEFFRIDGALQVTLQGHAGNEAGLISATMTVNDLVVTNGREIAIFDPGPSGVATFDGHQPVPGGTPSGLAAAGNTAYAALGWAGLGVYDVSGPLNPVLIGSAPGNPFEVKVQGNQVVTLGDDGLHIFDVTDPTLPVPLGAILITGGDFALDRHMAWVSHGNELIDGVDFSDPAHPILAAEFRRAGGSTIGLDAAQGFLHVVDYYGAYEIYSTATQPPTLLSTIATGHNLWDVTLDGDVAIVSTFSGLSFYRVSDPYAPQLLSEFPVYQGAAGVSIRGNRAAVELPIMQGLLLMDISDPVHPRAAGTVWGRAIDPVILDTGDIIAVYSYYDYSMHRELGWVAPDCQMAAPVALPAVLPTGTLAASPNPFNPRTVLSFTLPTAGFCRLTIHDLSGRLVRVLYDGNRDAGAQEFVWQGRDDQGHSAPSGVYLAQMVSPTGRSLRKLALIR